MYANVSFTYLRRVKSDISCFVKLSTYDVIDHTDISIIQCGRIDRWSNMPIFRFVCNKTLILIRYKAF